MDPRPPVQFGSFDAAPLIAEENRRIAGQTFACVACQIAIVLAACLSLGVATMVGFHQLAAYDAALKACAGV